jgi:ubiquinone biosynthesis protein UbiJ
MYEGLEELRKEVARLNARVEMMESKVAKCFETVARLMEELERLKRRARPPSIRERIEAYEVMEAGEHEPP